MTWKHNYEPVFIVSTVIQVIATSKTKDYYYACVCPGQTLKLLSLSGKAAAEFQRKIWKCKDSDFIKKEWTWG